jgi:predicted acylesterase/phospholipase RssA
LTSQSAIPPAESPAPPCGDSARLANGAADTNGGNDAVCFTAGFVGSTFGAGTIHAYLAADRDPPQVVAGISMGAITAAAMQRAYQELQEAPDRGQSREVARWSWFRQYLCSFADRPFGVIWDGLPKQSDFFADMIPVKDPTVDEFGPGAHRGQTGPDWMWEERKARRERYLFVKFGNWLATLPLPVSRIANLVVTYVRIQEKVPGWRLGRRIKYYWLWALSLFQIAYHIVRSPQWFPEYRFRKAWVRRIPRPLFGWLVYGIAWILFLVLLVPALLLGQVVSFQFALSFSKVAEYLPWLKRATPVLADWLRDLWSLREEAYSSLVSFFRHPLQSTDVLRTMVVVLALLALAYRWLSQKDVIRVALDTIIEHLLRNLELERALVYDFHLRMRLARTFEKGGKLPLVGEHPMPIVLVAAPLQKIQDRAGNLITSPQLWAGVGTPLIDALCTAICLPALFRPLSLDRDADINQWLTDRIKPLKKLDLVDGNVVRQNPIPALFRFLKDQKPDIIEKLCSRHDDPRIHVVYNVPLEGEPSSKEHDLLGMNIVDVVQTSLQLNKRRDTQLEVAQTNFIGHLEEEVRRSGRLSSRRAHPIFVDKIAPEKQIMFGNALAPRPEEILTHVAEGCRRSLEVLYKNELREHPGFGREVRCPALIAKIAPNRAWVGHPHKPPGLPEVCSKCTQWLARPEEEPKPQPEASLAKDFPMLTGAQPRIVFVASGGVFRGPFHGGMLACLLATQIRPDMIIGASVGTLMGGALGALLSLRSYPDAVAQLEEITRVFLEVDKRIAFTKCLKGAVREIGIRARSIHLSPNKVRRLIREGGRSDPGYATTGAPSALIDALSDLLMIPHKSTSEITGQFIAGHISTATRMLLQQMKSETLRRLEVQYAVVGTSLLEGTAENLLGAQLGIDLGKAQPFLLNGGNACHGIAFFGTTTDLVSEKPQLLGRYSVPGGTGTYNFVEAALASSAFPGVFAPRRESEVFPGAGRVDVLLSDGGMFDNLPFLPAIDLLGAVQRVYREQAQIDSLAFLEQRHRCPDLFIAGSLNVRPEQDRQADALFDDLITIRTRAQSLQNNVKIRDFEDIADTVGGQLDLLLESKPDPAQMDSEFIDSIVDATVLPVFPVDRDHLNPTYAFCASMGMKPERVQRSVADGCFQTFATLAEAQRRPKLGKPYTRAGRSIKKLKKLGRIPEICWARESDTKVTGKGQCPFFRHSTDTRQSMNDQALKQVAVPVAFPCPFYDTQKPGGQAIFKACTGDAVHKDEEALHPPPGTTLERVAKRAYSLARRI